MIRLLAFCLLHISSSLTSLEEAPQRSLSSTGFLKEIVEEIAAKELWDLKTGVRISEFGTVSALLGDSQRYEFQIRVGPTVLTTRLSEVGLWRKLESVEELDLGTQGVSLEIWSWRGRWMCMSVVEMVSSHFGYLLIGTLDATSSAWLVPGLAMSGWGKGCHPSTHLASQPTTSLLAKQKALHGPPTHLPQLPPLSIDHSTSFSPELERISAMVVAPLSLLW